MMDNNTTAAVTSSLKGRRGRTARRRAQKVAMPTDADLNRGIGLCLYPIPYNHTSGFASEITHTHTSVL